MESFFALFSFYAQGFGLLLTAGTAALIILFWDWRSTLAGLILVQLGVAGLVVEIYGTSAQWMGVQLLVIGLAALILGLSAVRVRPSLAASQPGNWLFRAIAIAMVIAGWWLFDIVIRAPTIDQPTMDLFTWLALCSLLLLGLSQNSLYTSVALLIWCSVAQAAVAILLNTPSLGVLIGMIELLLALACSYLMLVEPIAIQAKKPVVTDAGFLQPNVLLPLALREDARSLGLQPNRPALAPPVDGPREAAVDERLVAGSSQ